RQALEDRRPHPHRAGRTVQAGWLVLVVADPGHGEMVAGPAGEPAVAAVVAGSGLAGGAQMAQAIGDELPAGAGRYRPLQRDGHQSRGDRVAFLRGRRSLVVAVDHLAVAVDDAAHRMQRLDLALGSEELVK